ncbi:30S ribosomal protein S3 (mitochondrion) [Nannochloropsis oceanica]|uniref:30S ribosomal protein S3 n=1 Tax=Nannochloropsis oceanica TaxID=145522 RepID=T1R8B0_9STRA|nr:30S ribosomal protein S3 [Nannochloropsis oceanica]
MGQKINPIIFRQSITKPDISSWISDKRNVASIQHQDLELRNFLSFLLRSKGILLKTCKIQRSAKKLSIETDFYFSYLFAKQSKFFWAKNLFRTIKKKYVGLKKMRDLKTFVEEVERRRSISLKSNSIRTHKKSRYILLQKKRRKCFLRKKKKNFIFKSNVLTYKNRFCFFLLMKKARKANVLKKDSLSILGTTKNSPKSILLRLKFSKLKKLFLIKKFDYAFQNYNIKNSLTSLNIKKDKINLLNLNKALCKSLHHFTGFEDIHLKIYSTQLSFLPSFKLYQKVIYKKLFFFQKNKDLKKYFSESLETLYFILGTFGYGNAFLLSKLISYMIEDNRKHTQTVRFFKKSLQILFQKMPPSFFALDGIKILIKGRFNKRRRTKTIVLQQGQISLQTIETPIDYYQTQAITLYGAFGIKVWLAKKQFC